MLQFAPPTRGEIETLIRDHVKRLVRAGSPNIVANHEKLSVSFFGAGPDMPRTAARAGANPSDAGLVRSEATHRALARDFSALPSSGDGIWLAAKKTPHRRADGAHHAARTEGGVPHRRSGARRPGDTAPRDCQSNGSSRHPGGGVARGGSSRLNAKARRRRRPMVTAGTLRLCSGPYRSRSTAQSAVAATTPTASRPGPRGRTPRSGDNSAQRGEPFQCQIGAGQLRFSVLRQCRK